MKGLNRSENLVKLSEVLALVLQLSLQLRDLKIEPVGSLTKLAGVGRKRRQVSPRAKKFIAGALKAARIVGGPESAPAVLELVVSGLKDVVDLSNRDQLASVSVLPVAQALRETGFELRQVPRTVRKKSGAERAIETGCVVALPFLGRAAFAAKNPFGIAAFLGAAALCGLEIADVQRLENIFEDPFG